MYNRGVEKRKIFLTRNDYERFLRLLFLANGTKPFKYDRGKDRLLKDVDRGKPLVAIGAFALMPNHFHLLLKEINEGGISAFMEKLTTGFSSYFNKVHNRVGSLFQGTYKAEHADDDVYLKYLLSYIHLNPVNLVEPHWKEVGVSNVEKAHAFLREYRYSSYPDYADVQREQGLILAKQEFPDYFLSSRSFDEFLKDWLTMKITPHDIPV